MILLIVFYEKGGTQMTNTIQTISNDLLTVSINPLGAQLWSIQDAEGTEYLWQGNPTYWADRAINIFPYIARMTEKSYLLNGQKYQMDIHGFAKDTLFEITSKEADRITFKISDTPDTLKQYPFAFDFYVTYILQDNALKVEFKVINNSDTTMYFGVGGHPGFNVPLEEGLGFEDYYIEFSGENTSRRVIFSEDCFVMDGQFTDFKLNADTKYTLHHDMFDEDAIILTDMPRQITLASDKGQKKIQVSYPDMAYLGLWHMPHTDAPYICIEPWSSLPSRKGVIEDLAKQENLIALDAGAVYTNCWEIEI